MSISVSVDTSKLNELLSKVPGNKNEAVSETANYILGEARKNAPHRTGRLKTNSGLNQKYAGFVNVEFWQEYAGYVELGTHNKDQSVRMAARPFLKPATEMGRGRLIQLLKEGLLK